MHVLCVTDYIALPALGGTEDNLPPSEEGTSFLSVRNEHPPVFLKRYTKSHFRGRSGGIKYNSKLPDYQRLTRHENGSLDVYHPNRQQALLQREAARMRK